MTLLHGAMADGKHTNETAVSRENTFPHLMAGGRLVLLSGDGRVWSVHGLKLLEKSGCVWIMITDFRLSVSDEVIERKKPSASAHLLPGAAQERTLESVRGSAGVRLGHPRAPPARSRFCHALAYHYAHAPTEPGPSCWP